MKLRFGALLVGLVFISVISGCKTPESNTGGTNTTTKTCTLSQSASSLQSALAGASSEVDFSYAIERTDGQRFTYNRGSSTMTTSYQSASSSKLVTAVIILRLVEQNYLTLNSKPQDFISTWTITAGDSLYSMTLAQLLSFTSGLVSEPICLNLGGTAFETCVRNISIANAGNGKVPGSEFYYNGNHLQVAGLMAVKARGLSTWQDVFSEFKTQTGLFANSTYDLPSSTNPRLAGGMQWTANDYMAFLKALVNGSLLSTASMNQLLSDQIASATIGNSPPLTDLGEQWHYSFGLWHECQNSSYTCTAGTRMSSPGSYGAYPFWNRSEGYFGIVARQGALGTYPKGIQIERAVRTQADAWAACK